MSALPSTYNQTSLAYKYDAAVASAYPNYAQPQKKAPTPRIDVIPGGHERHGKALTPSQQLAISIAKCAFALITVFAMIGIGRVTLNSLNVQEALAARTAQAQLDEARSSINVMEVQQSTLSNPTRIKTEAEALGMSSAETVAIIDITGDVVATDDEGNLSITDSLAVVAKSA